MRRALAGFLCIVALGAAGADDDAPVLWPQVRVGDRWTYRLTDQASVKIYDLKVTFVGQDAIQAVSTIRGTDQEIDTTWTAEWNAVNDRLTGSFFPESGLLRFPLKPGRRYTSEYEVARPRTRDSFRAKNTLEVSVVGWQEVTVPAGTFRALKIDAPGTYERLDVRRRGPLHVTLWYAPEVRRWVNGPSKIAHRAAGCCGTSRRSSSTIAYKGRGRDAREAVHAAADVARRRRCACNVRRCASRQQSAVAGDSAP